MAGEADNHCCVVVPISAGTAGGKTDEGPGGGTGEAMPGLSLASETSVITTGTLFCAGDIIHPCLAVAERPRNVSPVLGGVAGEAAR